jgi:hypothetical protein
VQDYYPKRRADLYVRFVNGEAVLLDLKGNLIHQLNPTATVLWNWWEGRFSAVELSNKLTEIFDIDHETARHDVTLVLSQLERLNLLES